MIGVGPELVLWKVTVEVSLDVASCEVCLVTALSAFSTGVSAARARMDTSTSYVAAAMGVDTTLLDLAFVATSASIFLVMVWRLAYASAFCLVLVDIIAFHVASY